MKEKDKKKKKQEKKKLTEKKKAEGKLKKQTEESKQEKKKRKTAVPDPDRTPEAAAVPDSDRTPELAAVPDPVRTPEALQRKPEVLQPRNPKGRPPRTVMPQDAAPDILNPEAAFRALGDGIRLQIIDLIADGELCGAELLQSLNIVQSTLSHHMKTLCESGVVRCRRHGKWSYYSVNREILAQAAAFLRTLGTSESQEAAVKEKQSASQAQKEEGKEK